MSMPWPEDDEVFTQLVSDAMSDRRSQDAVRMRDALSNLGVIDRTLEALELIADRIDDQLAVLPEGDYRKKIQRAAKKYADSIVWYEQMRLIREAADG